mmetsp:Transcript_108051/g.257934  ORF Transcript_108051/g.257934 Transcript_108051/m.257934 type:complete len:404 (-) Transcript_108051:325-1536(-)
MILEVLHQVLEVLFPVITVAIHLWNEDILTSLARELPGPRLVRPGEEVGQIRLPVVENLVGHLPHHALVVAALATKPVVVVREAMHPVLLCQVCLAASHLALHQVVEAQSSALLAERLPEPVTFEVLQRLPVRVAVAEELLQLGHLVELWIIHRDDLRRGGHRRQASAAQPQRSGHEAFQSRLESVSFVVTLLDQRSEPRDRRDRGLQRLCLPPQPEAPAGHIGGKVLRFVEADVARVHQQQRANAFCAALAEACPASVAEDLVEDGRRQMLGAGLAVYDGACRGNEVQRRPASESVQHRAHVEARATKGLGRKLLDVVSRRHTELQEDVVVHTPARGRVQLHQELRHVGRSPSGVGDEDVGLAVLALDVAEQLFHLVISGGRAIDEVEMDPSWLVGRRQHLL